MSQRKDNSKMKATYFSNMVVVESHHESSKKFCITRISFTIIKFSQYIALRDFVMDIQVCRKLSLRCKAICLNLDLHTAHTYFHE